jgi:hypothetical protein
VIGQPLRFFDRVTASASAVYRLGVALPVETKPGEDLSISAAVKRSGVSALASHYAAAPEPAVTLAPGTTMLRADAQFAVDSLPTGRYALRAIVSVGGRHIGSVTTAVRKH